MVMTIAQRLLSIDSAHNVRHIGGYETAEGRRTRSDIIRSGSLHGLTTEGIRSLSALGVTTVFDLRSEHERAKHTTPAMEAHGIRHSWHSVFQAEVPARLGDDFPGFQVLYREMLHTGKDAYRNLFEQIALSSGGFLFHCTAGKDRTGLGAALLLELAGVHDHVIAEDYSHSAELIAAIAQTWIPPEGQQGPSEEIVRRLFASNAEDMLATLEYVRGCWGSSRGYMMSLGMPADLIARLRTRVVE